MYGYDVFIHQVLECWIGTDRRFTQGMEKGDKMRHFDKFVDTCDNCKKIVRVGSRTGDRILVIPRTEITYNIQIHNPKLDRIIPDCIDFGWLCPECYKELVEPKVKELMLMDNITDINVKEYK